MDMFITFLKKSMLNRCDLEQSHSNQIVKVLQPLKDSGIQKQELMDAIEILYKENATC